MTSSVCSMTGQLEGGHSNSFSEREEEPIFTGGLGVLVRPIEGVYTFLSVVICVYTTPGLLLHGRVMLAGRITQHTNHSTGQAENGILRKG